MENRCLARVGNVFRFLCIYTVAAFLLCSCASSDITRDVSSNIDVGAQHTRNLVAGSTSGEIGDSWQNASQTTKGVLIGGTAGAVTGAVSTPLGVLPGTLIGAVLGASYGSYVSTNESLADRLQNRGAIIVTLGDHVLLVLPSARIFHAMTATIKPAAYSTLNLVTRYLQGYTTMIIKVAAYTNAVGPEDVNMALSQAQADSVANYLMAAGLNARLLLAEGYGGQNLVARRSCVWGESDNYRIEITLEKQYV